MTRAVSYFTHRMTKSSQPMSEVECYITHRMTRAVIR